MAEFGIASRIVAPKIDPLAVAQQAQSIVGQGLQNRILGQQAGSKVSMGKAIGGAIDPATGQLDPNKVGKYYTDHPDESQFAPEALAAAQAQRQAQLVQHIAEQQLSQAELDTSAKENANAVQMGQGIQAGGDLSKEAIAAQGDKALPVLFKSPAAKTQWEAFKSELTDDPKQNAKLLQNFINIHGDISKAVGTVRDLNVGDKTLQVRNNPGTGETQVVGGVQLGRSPEAKATLVPVYDPQTQTTHMVPSGQVVGDAGSTAPKPMEVQAGPALGEADAAAGAVQQVTALRQRAERVPEVKAALTNIRDTVGGFTPGSKTNYIYGVKALAAQLGLAPPKVKDEVAAQEEFNKLATQFINQQVGQLGGTGTDAKLESARHGTPNEFMSKQGIQNVTGLMLGLEDAVTAKNAAWEKWQAAGNGPATYPRFVEQYNKLYDPRVFQSQYMDAKQKANMLAGMTKDEKAEFQKHWTTAKRFGWIK